MSPTEDYMATAMATYHSNDHYHRCHVKTLPAFILPGTVENEEQEEENAPILWLCYQHTQLLKDGRILKIDTQTGWATHTQTSGKQ